MRTVARRWPLRQALQRVARGRGHLLGFLLQLGGRVGIEPADALQQAGRARRGEQRQLQPLQRDEAQRDGQRVGQHAPEFAKGWSGGFASHASLMRAIVSVGREGRDMLGGELSFHLLNVLLLTLGIAPLVLWRYRRAVLAGMQGGDAKPLAGGAAGRAAPAGAGGRPRPAALGSAHASPRLRWRCWRPLSCRRCRCRCCTCS